MPIGWQAIGQPKSGKVSKPRYEGLIFFNPSHRKLMKIRRKRSFCEGVKAFFKHNCTYICARESSTMPYRDHAVRTATECF